MLNYEALTAVNVQPEPFPYLVVPNLLNPVHINTLQQNFPTIPKAGSFSLSSIPVSNTFQQLLDELHSDRLRQIIADKFAIDLAHRPVIITLRGKADKTDGRIHTDSRSKLITLLLYMNDEWDSQEGRLRLLYDKENLDHFATEIAPTVGKALIFKVTENGWHGHKPFIGDRKVIQLNYVIDESALQKHEKRHRRSAKVKAFFSRLGFQ